MVVFGAMATGKVVGQDITDAWLDKSINLLLRNDLVGDVGLEPTTPSLSSWCSNQLS